MINIKKSILGLCLVSTATIAFADVANAETLKTRNFHVQITRNCPEGNVTCNNVKYFGKNIKTGSSIRLTGKTLHKPCADGVTPCRFLGYEFRNQNYLYRVTADGYLLVYQGNKLVLREQGNFTY